MSARYSKGFGRRNIEERSKSYDQTVVSDDDDDESDTLTESLTSSQGRSSIGSIPWAEDAIKQNQIEWERIDRMFYGEEDLPSDPKLREEIVEWTSVFPYLRVTGKPIAIVEFVHAKGNDPFHEEMLMVDPPLAGRTRSSRSGRDGPNKQSVKDVDCVLTSCELDKCLYISSGQVYRQSHQPTHPKAGRRAGADLTVPEFVDRIEKPFNKAKPLNSLMVPQVPVVSVGSFGLLISNHCVGSGNYQALSIGSRNCSAQSVTHLSHTNDGHSNGGRSRNGNLQRKLAPLPHRPPQHHNHQQQPQHQQNKSSKTIETTILSASASATHNRIPPLGKNYKFLVQNSHVAPTLLAEIEQRHHSKLNVVKSATTRYMASSPTKHIFALPALTGIDGLVRHNPATGASGLQRSPVKNRVFRSEKSTSTDNVLNPELSLDRNPAPWGRFSASEAAYACVSELGELGLVQFRDLNPDVNAFQRKFVNEVRRCDEMERKLRYLEKEIKKDGIPMLDTGESPEAPQPREMIDLEATFEKLENELREVNQNAEALKRNYLELTELKHILRKTQVFFDEQEGGMHTTESMTRALITDESRTGKAMGPVQLGFVAGVILRERLPAFERMLWRACRGNVFLRQAMIEDPLEDPSNGDKVYKSVFIIFFQGDQLKTRVKKICEGFRATLYPCPEAPTDRREMAMGVMTRIEDLHTVLGQTQDHRHRVLVAAAKNLKNWFVKVRKIKAIYHTLNLFNLDVTQKCLIAECWVPLLDFETIQIALRRGTERSGSSVPPILNRMETFEDPPTYNRTNKFTHAFQALINAYGVASYREMNPAPYTIITFPFLFAVMFGDLGHGTIMALFGLWMVLKEKPLAAKKSDNEIWNIFFGGRYIIFLMGVFSMYTGFVYNDIFSKSLNVFGSSWSINYNTSTVMTNKALQLDPKGLDYSQTPYPIGLDPVWQVAPLNKIIFQNAYKMKISIIFGVIHMLFGVFVGLFNHRYFKNKMAIYCEFIPQVIFLVFLFFYMTLLMFIKWVKYSAAAEEAAYSAGCAPSILITFINMVLFKAPDEDGGDCSPFMFAGQQGIQKFLVVIALLCVPWMLLAKPILIMRGRKEAAHQPIAPYSNENGDADGLNQHNAAGTQGGQQPAQQQGGGGHGHDNEEMSEIFIHQGIHTIEYVLGSVSHTASYLRLWALSLAHAQLAEVLWNMVLQNGLKQDGWIGGIALWAVFAFWAVLTVGILVLMEGLSAFLHTLRLHWVEFQSKFYSGLGYAFQPFSFEVILESSSSSSED
uniref:V-type proton ATPase subunit a n=1 Tax=Anopheles dirus TaxID=7168 RepID=A0A182NCL5_9DIPT